MKTLKLSLLLSSLAMASCSTLNKHKTVERSSTDSIGQARATSDLQVHSVVTVQVTRPVVLRADSLRAYGVFMPVDSGIIHLIHISNGNITMDVTAQRQPGGGIKVNAAASTPQKTIMAPVDSTAIVDSVSHSSQRSAATVQKETVTKDKQVERKNNLPWWLWVIGGVAAVWGLVIAGAKLYSKFKIKLPV